MSVVVLDTDVASSLLRRHIPDTIARQLAGNVPAVTFDRPLTPRRRASALTWRWLLRQAHAVNPRLDPVFGEAQVVTDRPHTIQRLRIAPGRIGENA